MKIAIIAFGPFAGRATNGSETIARPLAELLGQDDHEVTVNILPVTWHEVRDFDLNQFGDFDVVVGLGEGFEHFISVERFATNRTFGKDVEA